MVYIYVLLHDCYSTLQILEVSMVFAHNSCSSVHQCSSNAVFPNYVDCKKLARQSQNFQLQRPTRGEGREHEPYLYTINIRIHIITAKKYICYTLMVVVELQYIYTHSQVISHWYLPDYVCTQMHIDTLHSHRCKICPAPAPEIASCGRPASPHRWWQERHSLRGFIDRSLNSNWWIYHVHQSFYHFLSVYTYIIIYPSSYSMFTDWIYKFFALKSSLAHSEHQAQ